MNSNSKPSDSGSGGAPSALGSSALATAAVGSADAVVAEKLSRLAAVLDELATVDVSLVSDDVLVEATVEAERLALRTAGAVTDRLIVEASDRDLPHSLGFRDIRNFMGQRLHIGDPAARYRVIAATGSFTTICGDRLLPACPTLAGYVVEGRVAGAHVRAVLEVLEAIPADISAETKAAAEAQMAGYADRVHARRNHQPRFTATRPSRPGWNTHQPERPQTTTTLVGEPAKRTVDVAVDRRFGSDRPRTARYRVGLVGQTRHEQPRRPRFARRSDHHRQC